MLNFSFGYGETIFVRAGVLIYETIVVGHLKNVARVAQQFPGGF